MWRVPGNSVGGSLTGVVTQVTLPIVPADGTPYVLAALAALDDGEYHAVEISDPAGWSASMNGSRVLTLDSGTAYPGLLIGQFAYDLLVWPTTSNRAWAALTVGWAGTVPFPITIDPLAGLDIAAGAWLWDDGAGGAPAARIADTAPVFVPGGAGQAALEEPTLIVGTVGTDADPDLLRVLFEDDGDDGWEFSAYAGAEGQSIAVAGASRVYAMLDTDGETLKSGVKPVGGSSYTRASMTLAAPVTALIEQALVMDAWQPPLALFRQAQLPVAGTAFLGVIAPHGGEIRWHYGQFIAATDATADELEAVLDAFPSPGTVGIFTDPDLLNLVPAPFDARDALAAGAPWNTVSDANLVRTDLGALDGGAATRVISTGNNFARVTILNMFASAGVPMTLACVCKPFGTADRVAFWIGGTGVSGTTRASVLFASPHTIGNLSSDLGTWGTEATVTDLSAQLGAGWVRVEIQFTPSVAMFLTGSSGAVMGVGVNAIVASAGSTAGVDVLSLGAAETPAAALLSDDDWEPV